MHISRAPHPGVTALSAWITGDARAEELATPEGPSRTQVDSVRFTRWHRHPVGPVLVVTEGTGLVQRRGGDVETIRRGDAVRIGAGEWHWHGATPTEALTHLAVEELPEDGSTAEFAEEVTGIGDETESAPPVSRVVILDQTLPTPLPTARVEIRRITIAPGHAAGLHIHNGPVFGSIELGSAIYQIEGEAENILVPGDVFYEPEGVRIARFDARDDGVTFLGYFLLPDGLTADLEFPDA
jgi:quercetin dioxygenase-like cupin family protein